ncbi:hypothetical protein JAAARDRAFT_42593 [Jaapia argillacea MUCL 33604]|uniref:F-box domain-containing protein n=1 Tax=Jaapia argillacea MUCL 33604 TaxID=933084 RepID=A0A067P4R6_9AGAM|nr:hypothetical protein JAAARDRAFT_42593 [Jaapia argillacea MUCL 33604]
MTRAQDSVFGIAEVCREVCRHIHTSGKRGDLARIARCSRLLMEPALDVLWEEILDMEHLLKLIPALEMTTETQDDRETTVYRFLYPPQSNDWSRFDFYGRRVRTLRYLHYRDIDCSVFRRLGRYRLTPMLPALRTLHWHHEHPGLMFGPEFISEVSPFISSSLRHISIGTFWEHPIDYQPPSDHEALESFLHMLPYRAPSVEAFEIYGHMQVTSFAFISRFQRLRVVNLNGIVMMKPFPERDTLTAFSTLPLLESIIGLDVLGDKLVGISLQPGFPSLTHLSLDHVKPLGVLILLKMISSRALTSLSISHMNRGSSEEVLSCVAYLSKFSSTLEEVRFATQFEHSALDVGIPIVEACYQLPKLQVLRISSTRTQEWQMITPTQAERMTQAWPSMRDLSLSCHLSFHSLKMFALQWHSLRSLSFGTLFADGSLREARSGTPILSHRLASLSIQHYSPNDDHFLIASMLDRLFPRFQVGYLAVGEVMQAIKVLQEARADQEKRVLASLP